ncbi:MAG: phage tail assembly chaperone [Rhizobiaceae bacterium]|nr:phage tail assembly chaperone [Rhizobiaceae bacterium]
MAIGLGVLRLSPSAFWAMTPREFERAVNFTMPKRGEAPGRAVLSRLMAAFPDRME